MKLTFPPNDLDLMAGSGEGRSLGLHASDIYTSLYQALEPNRYKTDSPPNTLMMAVGLAWEQWFERLLVREGVAVFRPTELETPEGISYSPDGLLTNGVDRLIEYKVTWMSSREDITHPKFDKWRTQVMFYLHALELTRVRFYVLHINGSYQRDTMGPELKITDIEFSQRELEDNRLMLLNHARHVGLL